MTDNPSAHDEIQRHEHFVAKKIRHLVSNITDYAVYTTDPGGYVTSWNAGAERIRGLKESDILGRHFSSFFVQPGSAADEPQSALATALRDDKYVRRGWQIGKDGQRFWVQEHVYPIYDDAKALIGYANITLDISQYTPDPVRLGEILRRDPPTNLPNRMAFFEALRDALHAPEPEPRRIAVLCVSLDRFKEFTDLFGRPVAEKLLRDIGIRLGATARLTFLAYDGAGAFLMIMREHATRIEPLANLLQATGNSEVDIEGHRVKPSAGVGIARFPEEGTDAESLIGSAEAAAFYAKADKNRPLRFFDPEMERKLAERRIISTDLRRAVERDELVLFYQPQTTLDGEITGFEALLRWRHPTRGLVMPGNFLPIAEEIGLVVEIGAWVLKEACREAATWRNPLKIAVNLSPSQLQTAAFPNVVEAVLAETGLQPGRLELEITESALIGDFQRAFSSLRRLKALGVLIAMDDFGTGYSSLSNLRAFPFDRIKIEGSFVADMETNRQSACIVRATIALGRSLGIPVTAEGVETRSQLEFLAREHCAEVQGFVNGIPMPIRVYADVVGREPDAGAAAVRSKAVR